MLVGRRVSYACPSCRSLFVSSRLWGYGRNPGSDAVVRSSSYSPTPASSSRVRTWTSTRSSRAQAATAQQDDRSEVERVVREARQRFRDTLPKGYLTEEEHQLYVRLYGEPLRETRPEDVGIPTHADTVFEIPYQPAYLPRTSDGGGDRQGGDVAGVLADVETGPGAKDDGAAINTVIDSAELPHHGERIETESSEGREADPVPEADYIQVDYISAVARSQREYDALVQLQADFEEAKKKSVEQIQKEQEGGEGGERVEPSARSSGAVERWTEEDSEQDVKAQEGEQKEESRWRDEVDESEYEDGHDRFRKDRDRVHPYTVLGRFRTFPSALILPVDEFVGPITELLRRSDVTHVQTAAEAHFGGRGLPLSPATPTALRKKPDAMADLWPSQPHMSAVDADAFLAAFVAPMYASAMSVLVEVRRRLGARWLPDLVERQDGPGQGPRVLDVGGGGAAMAAWNELMRAELGRAQETVDEPARGAEAGRNDDGGSHGGGHGEIGTQAGKRTVVVGSEHLRQRVSRFLPNTTFLARLPNYLHLNDSRSVNMPDGEDHQPTRKVFDVIMASHLLLPTEIGHRRSAVIDNLWRMLNPRGGVLVLIEKAHPRGFEAVAEARRQLLQRYIQPHGPGLTRTPGLDEPEPEPAEREPGMIVAPCTNHVACPMYRQPGLGQGRKSFCHFGQRYVLPRFVRDMLPPPYYDNTSTVEYSYVVVRRGVTTQGSVGTHAADQAFTGYEVDGVAEENGAGAGAGPGPEPAALPRSLLPPIKAQGHILLDVCTPAGEVERWTVPRSFSVAAYHDARKARWGDLWALGAKTRVPAYLAVGRTAQQRDKMPQQKHHPRATGPLKKRQLNKMMRQRPRGGEDGDADGMPVDD